MQLLIESVTKKCDGQTDRQTPAKEVSLSAYHATQGDTKTVGSQVKQQTSKQRSSTMQELDMYFR